MTAGQTPHSSGGRFEWRTILERCRRPVVVIAAVGTVISGLAGYIQVYRTVTSTPAVPALAAVSAAPAADPLSLVLLPLANLSGDPEKVYVADGLTAAMTNDLGRIRMP